jgi:hypothetical protein
MIYIMDLRPGSFSTFLSQHQESYSEELKNGSKIPSVTTDFMDSVESSLFEDNFYKRYSIARLMRFY